MDDSSTAPPQTGPSGGSESAGLLAARRGEAYGFLASAFFTPPALEMMRGCAEDENQSLFGLDAGQSVGELRALLSEADAQSAVGETTASDASREFMQLFKVPGAQYVTPYESVFRDASDVEGRQIKGLLMGQSAIDVQRWYRLAALDISADYDDMPDHIALELSYLAHLCMLEREFADAGDEPKLARSLEMQRDFLAAHIVSWIDSLRDKILEKTRHPYFRSVAVLAAAFTRRDLESLENLLGASSGSSVPDYEGMESQSEAGT